MYWKVDQLYPERDKFQRIFCRGTQYNYCAKEMCTTLEHPVTALEHPPLLHYHAKPDGAVVQVLFQEEDTSCEVPVVVFVRYAPAERPKLSSLLNLQFVRDVSR